MVLQKNPRENFVLYCTNKTLRCNCHFQSYNPCVFVSCFACFLILVVGCCIGCLSINLFGWLVVRLVKLSCERKNHLRSKRPESSSNTLKLLHDKNIKAGESRHCDHVNFAVWPDDSATNCWWRLSPWKRCGHRWRPGESRRGSAEAAMTPKSWIRYDKVLPRHVSAKTAVSSLKEGFVFCNLFHCLFLNSVYLIRLSPRSMAYWFPA